MKKSLTLFATMALASAAFGQLVITGAYDGPLAGGLPKGVELCAVMDIPDLSIYGIGSCQSFGGSDGEEWTFPADSAVQGQFIYVASEAVGFETFFGFAPDYYETGYTMSINGDDAVELFCNGELVDVFGEQDYADVPVPWNHLDGWASRVSNTPDSPTFSLADWTFSGPNAWDGETSNANAVSRMPVGTYWFEPAVPTKVRSFSKIKVLFD